VPDWWIHVAWWASGILGTGAVWYFLSTREYSLALAAGIGAAFFAAVAIFLHKKKDTDHASDAPKRRPPAQQDKMVTSAWWEASDLRKDYERRGFNQFRWSNADQVAEREQQGYEIVYLDDSNANIRYRIINRSGQVLMAKHHA
jgi:hypothetical protein